jgi:hypothetical protein
MLLSGAVAEGDKLHLEVDGRTGNFVFTPGPKVQV